MRILLIDENAADRKRTRDVLERFLPAVRFLQPECPTEVDAVLIWGGFDLVLTEYQISWTDGLALLRMIKGLHPRMPVVFVTGVDSAEVAVRAMKAGLSDYVLKAEVASQLPAVVQECLANRRLAVVPAERVPRQAIALSHEVEVEADRLWAQFHAEACDVAAGLGETSGPKMELQALVRRLYVEPDSAARARLGDSLDGCASR